jgi:hypothetical protein
MGLEIPQACSIASGLYIHFYSLNPHPYDEALKNSTLGTSMSSYMSIVLIKGVALPSTILESKTHAWHFLLAVYIGFEFILIQIKKRVV